MELTFLGRGSAFNTQENNNACYYKSDNGNMLLIDCGESVFKKIKEENLLDGVKKLYVIITHTHSDHVGSFGSLALFSYFVKKQKINIVITQNEKYNKLIKSLTTLFGLQEDWLNFVSIKEMLVDFSQIVNFEFLPTPHVKQFESFGLLMEHKTDGVTYYSSDTNSSQYLIEYLNYPNLDKIYIDVSKNDYKENAHICAEILQKSVPSNLRQKVYCMHIDDSSYIENLKEMGFNVVK